VSLPRLETPSRDVPAEDANELNDRVVFEPIARKRDICSRAESEWRRFTEPLAGDWGQSPYLQKYYFGERESACVFTLRRCLSTTRRNSRSMILKASCTTFASGSCVPLSICFSSATSS
jgi:hypothetical protein